MTTIRELRDREIVLRSLREGIDTSNATGRMVAGVLASLAELELELGRERRAAAREARRARGQAIGRPKALDKSKAALARRMHTSGEPVSTIAPRSALAVRRCTGCCRADRRYKPLVHGENARRELLEQPHQTALLEKVPRCQGRFHRVGVAVDDEVVHAVVDERSQPGHHLLCCSE